ncbi:hypothetical protein Syun_026092 [Stephania yunnanensis]|uniref:Uncharacterized protein n=1 Tax=Stephania yunnanensis TaxID=152371 RepID=A0AAP0EY94_9MAGN
MRRYEKQRSEKKREEKGEKKRKKRKRGEKRERDDEEGGNRQEKEREKERQRREGSSEDEQRRQQQWRTTRTRCTAVGTMKSNDTIHQDADEEYGCRRGEAVTERSGGGSDATAATERRPLASESRLLFIRDMSSYLDLSGSVDIS